MALVYMLLGWLLSGGLWPMTGHDTVAGAFTVLALVAAGSALTWMIVRGVHTRPRIDGDSRRSRAMLLRSERAVAPPLQDPDAPGKPRPRAPGAAPAAV
ncbi:MAG: DUF6412 domain-containing protein [Nocardiopsaceae bacterium]|nr:DUF6412 domain-containing protein [Nocardiopsaceae bacterium]